MAQLLAFWRPSVQLELTPQAIYQELYYGEEVTGLIDLPIQDMLAALKEAFPEHQERAGVLILNGAAGPLEWSWSWQYLRVDGPELLPGEREQIIAAMRNFSCGVFDVAANLWLDA